MHWRRKWQPTPVFLPGESQGQGSLVGCLLWGRTQSDTTEATQQQQQQCFMRAVVVVSHSVVSHSLQPMDWVAVSPSPGVCSDSIESVMPSIYPILCRPLLLLPSIFPSIRVFSSESTLFIRWTNIVASTSTSVLPMKNQA